ncbi:MAG: ATP-binding protein [Candidatus Eisenbacteria bacterium]
MRTRDRLHEVMGDRIGEVASIDLQHRTVAIRKKRGMGARHPSAVHVEEVVYPQPLDGSLLDLGRSVAAHGIDGDGPQRAARDLLLRRVPRFAAMPEAKSPVPQRRSARAGRKAENPQQVRMSFGGDGAEPRSGGDGAPLHRAEDAALRRSVEDAALLRFAEDGALPSSAEDGALRRPGETAQEAAVRLALALDGGTLAIQGPPGTGKTVTGAAMITALARTGAKVGVTAVSHSVIRNLLTKVHEHATRDATRSGDASSEATSLRFFHKSKAREGDDSAGSEWLTVEDDNAAALAAASDGAVTGGTAWLWAREDAAGVLDYLFIDEAGQMSLAHVLAASRAAKNLILLGDPQQLQQPQRGAHPEGADVSALSHLLGEHPTIPGSLGLFLDTTWRLAPSICDFTSELYYESRLTPHPRTTPQRIVGPTVYSGSGLFYVPVEHEANQSRSDEEVDAVRCILDELLAGGSSWIGPGDDAGQPLRLEDILVVAPYNAQVAALEEALPSGARVGTVDKFQGQEAAIVIYSVTSSSAADAPRGLEFLFDPHRLNVATSRARCLCILVAAPAVFQPECRTPRQMRSANGFCRFLELARIADVPALK